MVLPELPLLVFLCCRHSKPFLFFQSRVYWKILKHPEKIARFFIISILQGLINDGKLIRLPEEVKVMKPNPYVVFSMADGWLEDNTMAHG